MHLPSPLVPGALSCLLLLASCDMARFGPVKVPSGGSGAKTPAMSFHELSATDIQGAPFSFQQLRGHKVMVVNTASECGYTPQYEQLEELYRTYKDRGLIILGFPSNDFGGQEPGTEADIAAFCRKDFGVTFPLMSKVHTNGADQSPVYAWLTSKAANGVLDSEVKWNFQKYLVDEEGRLVEMLPSAQEPLSTPVLNWLDGKR